MTALFDFFEGLTHAPLWVRLLALPLHLAFTMCGAIWVFLEWNADFVRGEERSR